MTAKELKNALLQEAVQGKLVPQIASEGNARDLLEEIRKDTAKASAYGRAKLVKEGKIKREKPLPEITEDEMPFDIPENWCWCRLGEIINIKSGDGLTASQMQNGSILQENFVIMTFQSENGCWTAMLLCMEQPLN